MPILVGFASKEAYAHWKLIIVSTLLEPIAVEPERRAALTAFPDLVHDVFVEASRDHRAVGLDERGSFTNYDPLSMLLARND